MGPGAAPSELFRDMTGPPVAPSELFRETGSLLMAPRGSWRALKAVFSRGGAAVATDPVGRVLLCALEP